LTCRMSELILDGVKQIKVLHLEYVLWITSNGLQLRVRHSISNTNSYDFYTRAMQLLSLRPTDRLTC
jgi:hypothetical protein